MADEASLFDRLKHGAKDDWQSYVDHEFVRQMGAGTLPLAAFQRYLIQDYLFLIQFARAWALAAYKSQKRDDIRNCSETLAAVLSETELHIGLCARWSISKEQLDREEELAPTTAYTRFVLDCGASGDLLALMVALAPCTIGYAEIGKSLAQSVDSLENHPYRDWIGEYSCDSYQEVAKRARGRLDELGRLYLTSAREPEILHIFAKATLLEADLWSMGLGQESQ